MTVKDDLQRIDKNFSEVLKDVVEDDKNDFRSIREVTEYLADPMEDLLHDLDDLEEEEEDPFKELGESLLR